MKYSENEPEIDEFPKELSACNALLNPIKAVENFQQYQKTFLYFQLYFQCCLIGSLVIIQFLLMLIVLLKYIYMV